MKTPPFMDAVDVVIDGGEIALVCNACGPAQEIAKFFGKASLNQLVNAVTEHAKNRKDQY